MSSGYIETLEMLFQQRKLLDEHFYEYDEEYEEYFAAIICDVEPLLSEHSHDIGFVTKCMVYFPHLYQGLPYAIRCHPEVSLTALLQDRQNISWLPEELRGSQSFREDLFFTAPWFEPDIDFISGDERLTDKLLDKIAVDEYYFKFAPATLRSNRNFCLQAAERME